MNKQEELLELYTQALTNKQCKSKGTFADLLGVSRPALSSAFSGDERYLTENLLNKARQKVRATSDTDNETETDETARTIASLSATVESQQRTIEALLKKYVIG